jgi:cytochrome c553
MRRRLALAVIAMLTGAGAAVSGPSSKVAWTVETVRVIRAGDAAAGKKLNGDCAACHGEIGVAETPDVPTLAGQEPFYTYKQLQDYKTGLRANPIMGEAVANLSDRDMANLAAFYAAQKAPTPAASRPAPAIAKLVSLGDGARLIPACDNCHGKRGVGNGGWYGMPRLAIQKKDELSTELTVFKSGERANDVYRVMRDVAGKLTDAEIAALAAYYGNK